MSQRFRFDEFVVSPSRRILTRRGREIPLIPRYFDLLVLLIERRNQAVHRTDILEVVWKDVVVSDGALSQAVRTIRRALGDTAREPRFVRTVSRHGYRFVYSGVVEEPDEESLGSPAGIAAPGGDVSEPTAPGPVPDPCADPFEPALSRLLG